MDEPYPKMRPTHPIALPVDTGQQYPLWQALTKTLPDVAGKRVLVLHSADGWFCRYAVNHGAIAVLGVDHAIEQITAARAVASSDRLRYQILDDNDLGLLGNHYDLVVGEFNLQHDDLRQISSEITHLLTNSSHFYAAVTTTNEPVDSLEINRLFADELTIQQWYQVHDPKLAKPANTYFILNSQLASA